MKKFFMGIVLATSLISAGCAKSDKDNLDKASVSPSVETKSVDLKSMEKMLNKQLIRLGPDIQVQEINAVNGWQDFYQVVLNNSQIIYTRPDAKFIVIGAVLDMQQPKILDLTSTKNQELSAKNLRNVKDSDSIIYPAQGKKRASIYVFTDISCPYCHYIHKEVAELNKQGIEVKYLAYPRAGLKGETFEQMSSIWCSKDRQKALDMGYADKKIETDGKKCRTLVSNQYQLGMQMGVRGTPAVYTEQGEQIGGYIKAPDVLRRLNLKSR